MKYLFHPSVKEEFYNSVDYYEEIQKGLGLEFSKEVFTTIQRIIEFPESWPKLSKNTRRSRTKRFPYGVIYKIINNEIHILAIMHFSRKPGYWEDRLK